MLIKQFVILNSGFITINREIGKVVILELQEPENNGKEVFTNFFIFLNKDFLKCMRWFDSLLH